ncbi:hypothetical protein OS493_034429 [Desmophyllum pertusum]|uniref:Uncharacterized protein n=1 Tax=Desmophyllum pertusum TaxID=174260 RepID=A0A9W9ZKS5_9CNID|nr:hypothetical protein OS493_034429 [Desmophyllum pertusum]
MQVWMSKVQVHNAVPYSLEVAEHELCLPQFLSNIRKRKKLPDPYLLVGNNLPKSAGTKSGTLRKGKANKTQPPLMTIRNKSSTTTSSTSAATASNAEDSFAAATALMALSGSRSTNDDNFCLKELAGKYTS